MTLLLPRTTPPLPTTQALNPSTPTILLKLPMIPLINPLNPTTKINLNPVTNQFLTKTMDQPMSILHNKEEENTIPRLIKVIILLKEVTIKVTFLHNTILKVTQEEEEDTILNLTLEEELKNLRLVDTTPLKIPKEDTATLLLPLILNLKIRFPILLLLEEEIVLGIKMQQTL